MNKLRFLQAAMKLRHGSPALGYHHRTMAQKVKSNAAEPEVNNEPISFLGSEAATWRAKDTRSGGAEEELWYQPLVISGSLAVFLLYFCVLREENDIDRKIEGNLYDHVPALEEIQLSMTYKYNKENGLDNREVIKRLTDMGVDMKQLDIRIAEGN